jgi:hypothetical protein
MISLGHHILGGEQMSAQDIVLRPEEHVELSRRTRSATISQHDGRRARLILLAAQGCKRVEIARLVWFPLRSLTLWCQRFQERRPRWFDR